MLSRFSKNPAHNRSYEVYTIYLLITVFLFGFYGVYPGIKNFLENRKVFSQLTQLKTSLEEKKAFLVATQSDLARVGKYKEPLNKIIPDDYEVQNYLIEFAVAASSSGFGLRSFTVGEISENYINILVTLDGPYIFLSRLVKNIESLSRFTEITSINVAFDKDKSVFVHLNLLIYFASGSEQKKL